MTTRTVLRFLSIHRALLAIGAAALGLVSACSGDGDGSTGPPIPQDIQRIFDQPLYATATWGLRVVDLDTGEVLEDLRSDQKLLIGSVRKLFSVALALEDLGPDRRFHTPIHRTGSIDLAGVLAGNLVPVASGDLAMGGRTNPDGSFAITDFDDNEANDLGNAVLSTPDPLAGFDMLARQVAAAGVTHVAGDVVIDFRGQFNLSAMFINDDVVDVTINPGAVVDWRPRSAAFAVQPGLVAGPAGIDGSLAFVTDYQPDPTLVGTTGQVHAKTGTYIIGTAQGVSSEAQALAGYIAARSGRRLALSLALNSIGVIDGIESVIPVFQDQGTISAILWKLY